MADKKIRVLLVDDHTVVRKGIRALLEQEKDIEVVGEAEDGLKGVETCLDIEPDVVVLDMAMPLLSGVEAARKIKEKQPEVRILILSMYDDEEYIVDSFKVGVSGYILKDVVVSDLVSAVRSVYRGSTFLSPSVSEKLRRQLQNGKGRSSRHGVEKLTARERQILKLIVEGYTSRQISEILKISFKTVQTHRAHLMEKLDVHSTAELTRFALKKGLV
ncbi:response regulator [candidate division WOR-3 bacterium]|uniref:Response regulator n=1 Tax=candidate division WOR-3 bacterium TaxID=2052148 RepID=A0A9D5KBV8_UNCW3|nr:response regulator [candidate division WOR-3 bacterium]MBD3365329.1 response regulator [candidate division WOR-3 bacterium]